MKQDLRLISAFSANCRLDLLRLSELVFRDRAVQVINILKKEEISKCVSISFKMNSYVFMCVWCVKVFVHTYLLFFWSSLFRLFIDQTICNAMQNHLNQSYQFNEHVLAWLNKVSVRKLHDIYLKL